MQLANTTLISDSNLVAYWKLEANGNPDGGVGAGNRVLANFGTVTFVPAVFGNGPTFGANNTSNFMDNASVPFLTGGAATIVFWSSQLSAITSGTQTLASQYNTNNNVALHVDYNYNGGTPQVAFVYTKLGITDFASTYTTTLALNVFNHFALVYDGANISGYINGIQVAAPFAASGNGNSTKTNGFGIGHSHPESPFPSNPASVTMDDVAIFNRVLTTAEIQLLASRPRPAFIFEML